MRTKLTDRQASIPNHRHRVIEIEVAELEGGSHGGKCETTDDRVQTIENNRTDRPRGATLSRIADALAARCHPSQSTGRMELLQAKRPANDHSPVVRAHRPPSVTHPPNDGSRFNTHPSPHACYHGAAPDIRAQSAQALRAERANHRNRH